LIETTIILYIINSFLKRSIAKSTKKKKKQGKKSTIKSNSLTLRNKKLELKELK